MSAPLLRVLGPTAVDLDGSARPIRGQASEVACVLASRWPDGVGSDVLARALWPERAPADSRTGLRVVIHKLRQLLGDADAITSEHGGYRLTLPADGIDRVRFERVAADAGAAVDTIAEALSLWRGRAYDPFDDSDLLCGASQQLDALRLDLEERDVQGRLDTGDPDRAAMRASLLVDAEPYRERRWELLMMALYRTGRQQEALDVASRARARLVDDLGLEPGPRLVTLEHDILNQSEHLLGSAPAGRQTASAPLAVRDVVAGLRERRPAVPRSPGAFVGRVAVLDTLLTRLDEGNCITIVGPPGAGKTRLAEQACRSDVTARVLWVDLVGVTDETLISEFAGRLGLSGGDDVAAHLVAELSRQPTRLVFDNAERLVPTLAPLVEALIDSCPALTVLSTSRRALGLLGEVVVPLGPLAPDHAVRLLGLRVYGDELRHDDPRRQGLVDAVQRVEPFPLHLELLAPRLAQEPLDIAVDAVFSPSISTGPSEQRHQSLRAAIDWSMGTLSPHAITVHRTLGVFAGAAEAGDVAAVAGLAPAVAAEALVELAAQSLVSFDAGSSARYRQLVGVSQHALSELRAGGGLAERRASHANHFRSVAHELGEALAGPNEERASERLDGVMADIGAARAWFIEQGDDVTAAEIALALAPRTVIALDQARYRWLLDADPEAAFSDVANADRVSPDLASRYWSWTAMVAWAANDPARVIDAVRRARASVKPGGVVPMHCLVAAANHAAYHGTDEERLRSFVELLHAAEADGTAWERAQVATMMTLGFVQLGDDQNARRMADHSMALARRTGNPSMIAFAMVGVGWTDVVADPVAATRSFHAAVRMSRTTGARWVEGLALGATLTTALQRRRWHDACRLLPDALAHWGRTQTVPQLARSAREGVIALFEHGETARAAELQAYAELLAPGHPLLDAHQRRYDEIVELLDHRREPLDAAAADPIRSWADMVSVALLADDRQSSGQPKGQ